MARKPRTTRPTPGDLDPLIHERLRLGMLSALVVQESMSFTELRNLLQTTDGNLSVQARKLEAAGYVICDKKFEARKPKKHLPSERHGTGGARGLSGNAFRPSARPGSGPERPFGRAAGADQPAAFAQLDFCQGQATGT